MKHFAVYLFEKVEGKTPKKKKSKPTPTAEKVKFGNDERGKLFELGVGFHLNQIAHANSRLLPKDHPDRKHASPLKADGSFNEGVSHLMPSHFRPEGSTPRDVHQAIVAGAKAEHGPEWRQHYDKVMSHARQTANAIISHAIKNGHMHGNTYTSPRTGNQVADVTTAKIHAVHWTSQGDKEETPGDHEQLTGTKDTASAADVIISHGGHKGKRQFLGVSLKYGAQSKTNYRNPGTEAMSQLAGRQIGNHWRAHQARMADLYDGETNAEARHREYKEDLKHPEDHPRKIRAAKAEASAIKAKNAEAKEIHAGFSALSSGHLRSMISNLTNPQTVHPHLHVHGYEDEGYHRGFVPKVQEANQKFDIGIGKYESFSAGSPPGGSNIAIYGKPKAQFAGKVPTRVAEITLKGSSGPHKGLVGAVKADALTVTKDLSDRKRTDTYKRARTAAAKAGHDVSSLRPHEILAIARAGLKGKKR